MNDAPSWQWPEPQWRGHVDKVRAGRALAHPDPARRWKGGAKAAVLLSFDSDHETPSLRDSETSPGRMAQGEYGARVGVPRILELLRRYEAPASFYIPAVCALLRPDEVPTYVEQGHEVAVHGWIHERNTLLSYEQELDLLGRATDVLHRQSGARPVGIRTPSWDFSDSTLDVIRELGFVYDSSLMADDEPYELLADGSPTGIVEIPVEWIRDDAPYLMMDRFSGLRPHAAPSARPDLEGRIRRRLCRGRCLPAHHAPAHHRPPLPDARAGRTDGTHPHARRRLDHHARRPGNARCIPTHHQDGHFMSELTTLEPIHDTKLSARGRKAIIAGGIGNAVEWVDWAVYTTFSSILPTTSSPRAIPSRRSWRPSRFSPSGRDAARRRGGHGRLRRPHGRKKGLVLTIGLMAGATAVIGFAPTYERSASCPHHFGGRPDGPGILCRRRVRVFLGLPG